MLTDDEIKVIIKKNYLEDYECIGIIQRYIYDLKGKEVEINKPVDFMQMQLMDNAYNNCLKYYIDKFKL